MPREATRQSAHRMEAEGRLQIRISQKDSTVRVVLSGILDSQGVERIVAGTTPLLLRRGYRVILDGSGLAHLDYRATRQLIRWNRHLRRFRHRLFLLNWSDYLKAILCMEDWDRELGGESTGTATWRLLGGAPSCPMP